MYDDRETETINELRGRLKAELDKDMYEDDYLFFRFLKYNDFDVDAAEQMLKQHLEWRKKHDVSNFSKFKIPEVLEKYLPNTKLGYDKQGCIVRYMPSGNADWIGLFNSCKSEDLLKLIICIHEMDNIDLNKQVKKQYKDECDNLYKMSAQNTSTVSMISSFLAKITNKPRATAAMYPDKVEIKFGKKAGKVLYIHNLENLSFTQATDKKVLANFINLMTVYLNNYPKTLKAIIVINASMYFHLLYSLMKKFLPNAVLQKVIVFSDDSFKEELLKRIDADVLPAFLGGKRTDPDGNPLCLTFVNHGRTVPEKYYIHRSKRSLSNLPDAKKLTLSHAAFHEEYVDVTEPESYLEWEIEIKSRDIGFGLYYQDKDEKKIELVPLQRINTDEYAESGIYKCDGIGTYIILFDNTYSFIRSKVIYYKIKVLTAQDEASLLAD